MKRQALAVCMTILLVSGICQAEDERTQVSVKEYRDVRAAMQNRQYGDAVKLIDTLMTDSSVTDSTDTLTAAEKGRGFLMYLKALALFHSREYERSIQACDEVIKEASPWHRKAVFLKAQCHISLKHFQEAEGIYDTEVRRLLSEARKEDIAGVYFRFAEAVSRKPEKDELDAPPPDYMKAYQLYTRALELETGHDMRDEATFQQGRMMHLAGDYSQAAMHYRGYLDEYDPEWMGDVDAPGRQKRAPGTVRQGKHAHEARYHLAECQLAIDQTQWARMNLEDLLTMITPLSDDRDSSTASRKLARDARYLMIQTYHIPTPSSDEEMELGVKAVRAFLADFPEDTRCMRLSFEIGESYQRRNRSQEAIQAYQEFLKTGDARLETGDGRQETEASSLLTQFHELRMSATYRIGEILFQQKDYTGAVGMWNQYVGQFPNGQQWTDAQQGIVNAEFQMGVDLLADERYDEAVKAWDEFLERHPLDERSRQIMFVYGQMHYHRAEEREGAGERGSEGTRERGSGEAGERGSGGETESQKAWEQEYRKAISEWEKLVSKYPNTEESSLALFRTGQTYEEKLLDLEKALEAYRKLTWGSWYGEAQNRIQAMVSKKLTLTTERVFRTSEKAQVKVTLRNIQKLTVSVYKVDLEAYWRKMHSIRGVEKLDIALIAPDSTWEHQVTGYQRYRLFYQAIEIPMTEAGVYVVNLGEDDLEATTLVIRSDIDAIIKTSHQEVLVFAQDMLKMQPAPGARVLVSDGTKVIGEGETGADGVFHRKLDGLKATDRATVFVIRDGSVASDVVDMTGLGLSAGLTSRGYIYTDRPAYRPGGKVGIRGVIRDVKDGGYTIGASATEAGYRLSVTDSQGRLLVSEVVKLSRFGTFHTEVALDGDAPVGEYRITAEPVTDEVRSGESTSGEGGSGKAFTGSFLVQRYQLEKMKLELGFDRQVCFRGEKIEATFTASFYYGQPVAGSLIRYTLPDGRSYTQGTDAGGRLVVAFDTTPMQPDSILVFTGSIEGENVQVRDSVYLARLGFSITVQASAETVISGEPFGVTVTTTGADGKPVGVKLTLSVYQQMDQRTHPILSQVPWLGGTGKAAGEVKVEEHSVTTDGKTGRGEIHLSLSAGGRYMLRASGVDQFSQPVTGEGGIFISDDRDAVKLRVFSEQTILKVGEETHIRIHSRLTPVTGNTSLALVTFEGEGIISYRVEELVSGWNDVSFQVSHSHFPNFHVSVTVMDGQRLQTAGRDFTVERELKVSLKLAETYQPGEEGEVEVTATDQMGKAVECELSLALVDEALFSIYPDTLPAITSFFSEGIHRDAAMRTAASCSFSYHAITQNVIRELLEEEKRLLIAGDEARRYKEVMGEVNGVLAPSVPLDAGQASAYGVKEPEADLKFRESRRRGRATAELAEKAKQEESYLYARQDIAAGYDAAAARFGTGAGGQEIAVREEFADAGYWLPVVVTDASGKAAVNVPMPQKTSQWRLTARGCTVETLVGQTTIKTITRKDFFLDVKAPSILTEGDEVRVLARVHNLTEAAGSTYVMLKLKVDDTAEESFEKTISVEKNSTTEVVFDAVRIPAGREAQVEVTAQYGKVTGRNDGVSRVIPIRPWGMEYADSTGGVSSGDETIFLQLPAGLEYKSSRMTVSTGSNVNRLIFHLAMDTGMPRDAALSRYIPRMPGDAGSDLLAAAYALGYLKQVGGDTLDNRDLLTYARGLVARLVVSQRDDGGWSWCHGSAQSDVYASSRALWALAEARGQGVAVHPQTIERAAAYLKEAFAGAQQNDDEAKSVILHALSRIGEADFAYANRLYRSRNSLNPAALAYTALVFANLDRREIGGEVLDVLESKMAKGEPKRLASMFRQEEMQAVSDIETSAIMLLALESISPDSPLVQETVEYLLARRTFRGYSPYQAKGAAVAALAVYYGRTQYAGSDYRLSISVNGEEVGKMESRGQQSAMLIHVPAKHIKAGQNSIGFHLEGRGSYAYTAALSGFSPELNDPESWDKPNVQSRGYYHAPLEYKGRQVASSTSVITQLPDGERTYVSVNVREGARDRYLIVQEYLPAGTMLVDGSLSGQYQHYETGDGVITFYYPPGTYMRDYQYQLVSYAPGTYRALPTVIQDTMRPGEMRMGKPMTLTVLAPGEASADRYEMNDAELYGLGKAHFDDGTYDRALEYLTKLYERNQTYQQRETARMLLWIHTEASHYDDSKVIQYFEVLRERFPELYIPFEKILVVGRAYRDMEEYERAYLVYKATIDASFVNDSSVSAVLEDEGQFLSSIDFQDDLWWEYPDTPQVTSSYFALSQAVYSKAPEAGESAISERFIPLLKGQSKEQKRQVTRLDMLKETVLMLSRFLTLYPEDPLADDAAFSLANALLDLEDFPQVVTLCQTARKRYSESEYLTSFQYVEALGYFSQHLYDEAVDAAMIVADGRSRDRDLARYILGQIHHARGKPDAAIEWYEKVKGVYPDAQESISFFQEKRISLDEVKVVRPDEAAKVTIRYRNIQGVSVQVYQVDLMKLYLREKDLSNIRAVQLAGISPQFVRTATLGDGRDYTDKEYEMALDVTGEGAYLVICRGDDLFTSGLVLITPLGMEVHEDAVSGRVRVNVRDVVKGVYREGVHVKAVGSSEKAFRSGRTDLRGLFIADDIRGKVTVIARDGANLYAFHRGTLWLGQTEERVQQEAMPRVWDKTDYRANISETNQFIQAENFRIFDQMRRGIQKGVQVQQAE